MILTIIMWIIAIIRFAAIFGALIDAPAKKERRIAYAEQQRRLEQSRRDQEAHALKNPYSPNTLKAMKRLEWWEKNKHNALKNPRLKQGNKAHDTV